MPKVKQQNSRGKKSLKRNNRLLVGALGPEFTFTDNSAQWLIDDSKQRDCTKKLYNDIEEVVEAVKKGEVNLGVIPIENVIHGSVRETLDSLFLSNLQILFKYAYPIKHVMAVKKGTLIKNVRCVYSHNQALSQCKKYLKKDFKKTEKQAFPSTVSAIKSLLKNRNNNKAVICSKEAALKYNLRIIKERIEDKKGNKTYFIVIGRNDSDKNFLSKKLKVEAQTSMAFFFGKDKPGTLYGVFKDFKDNSVNLTKIESRPTTKRFGEYIFFLDFEGKLESKKVQKVIEKVEDKVASLKIFGSYSVYHVRL